jgi:putative ABC transport system permease protein
VRASDKPNVEQVALLNVVSPDWFGTYATPFVAGRDFDERDSATTAPVVIVNQTMARLLFGAKNPIGERLLGGPLNAPARTIVGVARDAVFHSARLRSQSAALRDPVIPTMYLPLAQSEGLMSPAMTRITISVRPTSGSPSRLAPAIGARLESVNPNVSFSFRTLADVVDAAFVQERLTAMLSGIFGALALSLAGLGLYGVSAYAVAQRRTEIGVRVALGASPRTVFLLILRRVAILTGAGLVEGVIMTSWVLGITSSLLFGLSPGDPTTLIVAILTVVLIGLIAGALPAWRAARVDPMIALRAA